jgi:nicotinamidase-related amidase
MSLRFGPLSGRAVHLCIDMQNVFAEPTPCHTPWMARVLPAVEEIAGRHATETVFTRFIPPARAEDMPGTWQRYFHRWKEMTPERIDPRLFELMPSSARSVPPAVVVDKHVYSPFYEQGVLQVFRQRQTDTLVITGAETGVCVLAALAWSILVIELSSRPMRCAVRPAGHMMPC